MPEWDYKVFWDETMSQLRKEIGEAEFTIWLSNVGYLGASENEIHVSVPSAFFQEQFKPRYHSRLEEKMRELTGKNLSIVLSIGPGKSDISNETDNISSESHPKVDKGRTPTPKPPASSIKPEKPKEPHPLLNKDFTFEKYVIGDDNRFAANAAMAIRNNPGVVYNPFLIYGGVGLGKTHLMQAIGNYIYDHSEKKVTYITSEDFFNEFLYYVKIEKMNIFKNKFRNTTDVLLMDDIQFFQTRGDSVKEELYHTFNTLLNSKKAVVFTCDRPVEELKMIPERLLSRFKSGIKADLSPPRFETRRLILQSIDEREHAHISVDVIDLVSKNVSSNVRDLIAAFNNLIAMQELMQKPITIEDAQRFLSASPKQTNLSTDLILKVVAGDFHLSANDLRGKKRSKNIVTPRHIAMYLAKEMTEYSTTEIGQDFGGRDHSTVISACRKVETQVQTDTNLYAKVENLKRLIRESSTTS